MHKSREFGIREEQGGGRKEKNVSVEVGKMWMDTNWPIFSSLGPSFY